MQDLLTVVTTQKGTDWRSEHVKWEELEGYDLAVGPKSGRCFPAADESPTKPRKLGQISQYECTCEIYGVDTDAGNADTKTDSNTSESDDLSDVYGSKCYLAVRTITPKVSQEEKPEWFEQLPFTIGMRKGTALKLRESVVDLRLRKRYPPYGTQKTRNRAQNKRKGYIVHT